jgi:uroporphyrinogen-III synthase
MKSKVVAILETRTGEHLAELISRRGAVPMRAPALEEVPDVDSDQLSVQLEVWAAHPFTMAIFQTGVGTRALFEAAEGLGATSTLMRMLDKAVVVVRGPKPLGELKSRGVRIDIRAATPFTTETVLDAVAGVALERGRVLVQRYGEANRKLCDALRGRGATVEEIATYRWALPEDTGPLERLIEALASSTVHAVVFTSAVQVRNLYAIADRMNRGAQLPALLNACVVASIGPVCTAALMAHGVKPTFEANPPKLGPLVQGLEEALHRAG